MVYRATEHIRNEDVYGYIDRIGGRYTGGTSRDGTTYGETVPSWALEEALRTTAERMGRALFDSLEFERERNNVVTEANGFARQDPLTAYRDALMLASFEIHPYRYSSNTWARDNLAISRSDAYEFYKRYYGPNNAVLTVVGDVQPGRRPPPGREAFRPRSRGHRAAARCASSSRRSESRSRSPCATPAIASTWTSSTVRPLPTQRDYTTLVVLDRIARARDLRRALPSGADVTTSHTATPYPFVYRISIDAPVRPGRCRERLATRRRRDRATSLGGCERGRAGDGARRGRSARPRWTRAWRCAGAAGRRAAAAVESHADRQRSHVARGIRLGSRRRDARASSARSGERVVRGHQSVRGSLAAPLAANRRPLAAGRGRLHAAVVERPCARRRPTRGAAAHDAARAAHAADARAGARARAARAAWR